MQMIINGLPVDAADGAAQENRNPATGALVGTVPAATREDVAKAVAGAHAAQPAWQALPLYERTAILERYVELVAQNAEEIAQTMCAEGGKPIGQCRQEVAGHNNVFKGYIHAAHSFYGASLPQGAEPASVGDVAFTIHEPLGVVACVMPFNFPVSLYAHKVAPALVTGNAVIVKPASDTPMATLKLVQLLQEAGLPAGVAQGITGSGGKIGNWLTDDPRIAAISLTGSTEVGVQLAQNGTKHLQRIFLELGGNDPLIIFDDADLSAAVSAALLGRLTNAGQICSANKRLIVHNRVQQQFAELLVAALKDKKMGDPADPQTDLGPLVNEKAAREVEEQVARTIAQGVRCLLGGKRAGAFFEPTVLVDVTPEMDVARDLEIFGPVFPIIGFETLDEALAIANATCYGLSSGVFTENIKTALQVAHGVKAGACYINGSGRTRTLHQPFGGYKMSGVGREGFLNTLSELTQIKTISFYKALS